MQKVKLSNGEIVTVSNNDAHTLIEEGAELIAVDDVEDTSLKLLNRKQKIGKGIYGNSREQRVDHSS